MTFQTFTGREYLKIDIANNYGLDKMTWDQRIAWFDMNEYQLEAIVDRAAEPALFFAGTRAWRDVQAGRPIGYMISLDATSSGLQILAALTGDRSAAQLCNVVDTGDRQDAYTNIYNIMLQEIGQNAKIKRDDVKQAIMTSLYSSKAVPKKVFGEGELLALFYSTMEQVAPAAWELNETMLGLWNPETDAHCWVMPDNFHVNIKVIDTVTDTIHFDNQPFQVSYKVNQPMAEGRSLGANMVHAIDGMIVREMVRRCSYNPEQVQKIRDMIEGDLMPHGTMLKTEDDRMVVNLWNWYQATGYLSARILDHLTEDNFGHLHGYYGHILGLLDSLPKKPFSVVPVHDCFRCLPHYGNDLRRQYNRQLEMIASSHLLASIISQLIGKTVMIGKLDPNLHKDIAQANYALS